jgi:predicted DNA-binding transcriptional regulator AlpA
MILSTTQQFLSLKETAEYLGIGERTAQRDWPSWERYGVVPSRMGSRVLRFKKADLDQMMESLKVVKAKG